MKGYLIIIFSSIFINNFVFSRFLGICPYIGVSRKMSDSTGMGFAVTFVLLIASISSWIVRKYVLVPLGLEYMQVIFFVLIIGAAVQFVEMAIRKMYPALYRSLGIYIPLIASNSMVLAIALLTVKENYDFPSTVFFAFGSGLGFMLALILMSSIRERLDYSDVPEILKGEPVAFIVAGLIAMAFIGLTGLM